MELDIRFLRKADLPQLIDLLYICHGYTYPLHSLYDPEKIWQKQQEGMYRCAGAFDQQGRLVAHMAACRAYAGARIFEYDFIFIHPDYRRHKIGYQLGYLLDQWLEQQKAVADYSTLTCAHPYAQKLNLSSYQKECALGMAYVPQNMVFRNIGGQDLRLPHRDANLLVIHPRGQQPTRHIYLPRQHRDFLLQIYAHLGLAVEERTNGPQPRQPAEIELEIEWGCGFGGVEEIKGGYDSPQRLTQAARKLVAGYLECVYVLLRLDTPTLEESVQALEQEGFFVVGLFPCFRDGDTLLMQYVLSPVHLKYLHLVTPMGKILLDYILSQGRLPVVS